MKKQFKKKLRLNKSTVSNLSPDEMRDAFAGGNTSKSCYDLTNCFDCSWLPCLTTSAEAAAQEPEEDNYLQ